MNRGSAGKERVAVLYPGIDAFKSYNDHDGFVRGDDVIKTLSTIILETLEENPSKRHFAGHVGGGDLVVLTQPPVFQPVADEITKSVHTPPPPPFDLLDPGRGLVEVRGGQRHQNPG